MLDLRVCQSAAVPARSPFEFMHKTSTSKCDENLDENRFQTRETGDRQWTRPGRALARLRTDHK